jgi:hypothetical protein
VPGGARPVNVAVLRVRDGTVDAEAETLLKLGRHPNLVRFYGQCRDGGDVLLVTELAPMGSLSDLIERLDEEEGAVLPRQHKLAAMQQVVNGMAALAAEKLIHRDLAIRNVLVCAFDPVDVSKMVCKVSDFGLTVNGYTAAYKYVEGGPKPTRYLAPESLERGRYSEKSDVWAFGVLVWELVTDGKIPYFEMPDDTAVIAHVCGGGRLVRPATTWCPDALWAVTTSCWAAQPRDRPTFQQLGVSLGQLGALVPAAVDEESDGAAAAAGVVSSSAVPLPAAAHAAAAAAVAVTPKLPAMAAAEQEDPEVARYRLAANQGDASAQDSLGVCYANGRGVPKDEVEAVRWFRLAADQGDDNAQHSLGECYVNGRGVPKDEVEAVRWYRLAANQGYQVAQDSLGVCYAFGKGVPKDEVEAVRWYRLAANQGHYVAQHSLGECYADGEGVPKDEVEAVRWYRLAADQGYQVAQYELGECYANGKGVPKNMVEAVRWNRLAAAQGFEPAQQALDRI